MEDGGLPNVPIIQVAKPLAVHATINSVTPLLQYSVHDNENEYYWRILSYDEGGSLVLFDFHSCLLPRVNFSEPDSELSSGVTDKPHGLVPGRLVFDSISTSPQGIRR